MIMNRIYSFLGVCLLVFSCGEPLMDYDINTETPVVEGYLQEGANSLTVKVYTMEVYHKDAYELSDPIERLTLKVNGLPLTETAEGTYSLDLGEDTLRENQECRLQFDYNGQTVEASTTVPQAVQNLRAEPEYLTLSNTYFWDDSDTTAVDVTWDNTDGSYYQVYIESPNTENMPSFGVFGQRMMQPFKGNTYRATARDFRSAGHHFIYVYRVGRDYAELYEQVSSTDLANPVSFIDNAFGIFTAMSVARVRIWVSEASTE
jgi:hypothetical protein